MIFFLTNGMFGHEQVVALLTHSIMRSELCWFVCSSVWYPNKFRLQRFSMCLRGSCCSIPRCVVVVPFSSFDIARA